MFVRKSELNNFKNQDPQTVEVMEGEPVELACQPPDGYPKPSVYWMIQVENVVFFSAWYERFHFVLVIAMSGCLYKHLAYP